MKSNMNALNAESKALDAAINSQQAVHDLKNVMLRAESGDIMSTDKVENFIYVLLRDHLTAGDVESLTRSVEDDTASVVFCNGWIAQYAKNVAKRLK